MTTVVISACTAVFLQISYLRPVEAQSRDRPNVIVIFTDDQGYHDLGCFGSQTIKTPQLDRMAAEGLRLTNFYAQPVCGVSRAALMTGCYPIRVAEPGNLKRLHTVPHPDEWTMAEMLKQAGYATALIGKWHLGENDATHPTGFDQATMPNAQGFDYFYGTPAFNGFTTYVQDAPFRSPILRNDQVVTKAVQDWNSITADYTDQALRWIEQHRDRPFFLYLAHNMPHVPLGASQDFKDGSDYGPYGDTIEEIDWSCGQVLRKLKSLGLDEKTLIVFTSDNGPWIETTRAMKPGGAKFIPRDHSGSADPLRGWKMSAWEGGSRVPCIVRWPETIPAGRVSDEILTTMDLMPTFAAIANTELPSTLVVDGLDATDFLLGRTDESPREEYLYYAGCLLTGVRVGAWKLVLPRTASPPGTGWWGRMIDAVPQTQLFNLVDDPGERVDIADQHPDVVATLMKRIELAREQLGDIDRNGTGARFFDQGPRRLESRGKDPQDESSATKYDNAVPLGNLRFTFEQGDWQGWRVIEGSLPDAVTNRIALPNHKTRPFNKQGDWFVFTGQRKGRLAGDDGLTGVLESPIFTLRGDRISFLVGGGAGESTYAALCTADGNELRQARGTNSPVMHRVNWDVGDQVGKKVKIRIVDESTAGWGHVSFDDFSCQGQPAAASRQ